MNLRSSLQALLLMALVPALGGCFLAVVGGAAAGANAAHDRRSFGTVFADNNIELTAYDAINRDKELALKNNVGLVVYNGVMLMVGQVRTAELRDRAQSKVDDLAGIKRLVNEIVIGEPTGVATRTHDKWITGRVKTALLDIVDMEGFDPTRVNVTTENGVVYLMGLVDHVEGERVVEIARGIPGVTRVVKVFDYTD